MFTNHISIEQMKLIFQKRLFAKSISPTDQSKQLNKKRKVKKKKGSTGTINEMIQNAENIQDTKDCTQQVKQQDVSLNKHKHDENEEKIIKDQTLSPPPKQLQEITILKNNDQKQKDHNIKDREQKSKSSEQKEKRSRKKQKQMSQESLECQQKPNNNENTSINDEDKQQDNQYKSIIKNKSDQKGRDNKQIITKEFESNTKHNKSIHDIERESQMIQKLALLQFSPYTDRKQKQKIKSVLKPIIELRQLDKLNKQKRLQPIKQSQNSSPNNAINYSINDSSRTKDEQKQNNLTTNNQNPILRLRSSSFKASPKQTNKLQGYGGLSKMINKIKQDNFNFYQQNSQRNNLIIPVQKNEKLNMSSEERNVNTDYSIFRKNKKLLDDQLYSTQYASNKKHALSIDLSFQQQENHNQSINEKDEEDANFYKDFNESLKSKQKNKIYRSNSSRKQHDERTNSIEKIYKNKIPCLNDPFSPIQKNKQANAQNKQKKSINSIGLKDIKIYQSSQKSNVDNLLPKIQETQQSKNK